MDEGLLTEEEAEAIVSEAAQSDVGKPDNARLRSAPPPGWFNRP